MIKTGGVSLFTFAGNKNSTWHYLLMIAVIFVSGCSVTQNLEEIKTLQSVAKSQEQIEQDIAADDKVFATMMAEYQYNQLAEYKTRDDIVKAFGEPEGRWDIKEDNLTTKWLYREAADFFKSAKLYLYFDHNENLIKIEFVPVPQ